MDHITAHNHTLSTLNALVEADAAELLAQWCEWNDANGDYRADDGTLWTSLEYWGVIYSAFNS